MMGSFSYIDMSACHYFMNFVLHCLLQLSVLMNPTWTSASVFKYGRGIQGWP